MNTLATTTATALKGLTFKTLTGSGVLWRAVFRQWDEMPFVPVMKQNHHNHRDSDWYRPRRAWWAVGAIPGGAKQRHPLKA